MSSDWPWLDERPILITIAGPNGAGKTTFYHSHVAPAGLRLVNADRLANELSLDPYTATQMANSLRETLVRHKESFAFETVFSDPIGDKVEFLRNAAQSGYTVALFFIGLETSNLCLERVAMRVTQGGHDVPDEKIVNRFPRTLANLKRAIQQLPRVLVYDNSDLAEPYRLVAAYEPGQLAKSGLSQPTWFTNLFAKT